MVNLGPHKTLLNSIAGNPIVPRECKYCQISPIPVGQLCPSNILNHLPQQINNNGMIIFNI